MWHGVIKTESELALNFKGYITNLSTPMLLWLKILDLKITFVTYTQITDHSYILNTDQLSEFNDM